MIITLSLLEDRFDRLEIRLTQGFPLLLHDCQAVVLQPPSSNGQCFLKDIHRISPGHSPAPFSSLERLTLSNAQTVALSEHLLTPLSSIEQTLL